MSRRGVNMAPPETIPASPYNFGLGSDFEIALIQPFLYFFSTVFLDIYFPLRVAPKTASLTENLSPNTCSLTPPDELLASVDQRRNTIGEQAAISLFFILMICRASHYLDFKWHDPYAFHSRPGSSPSFLNNKLLASNTILPPDDYRVSKSREAMRLLFLVVISGLLCPIADYLCRRGDGALVYPNNCEFLQSDVGKFIVYELFGSYRLHRYEYDAMMRLRKPIMFLMRIALPCMATAATTKALAFATFGRRYGVVDIWDRRVELWVEAWKKEKLKAEKDELISLREKFDLQKSMKEAQDEAEIGERNKELLVWRRGMKEGKGYGPDYWLPREKGATPVRKRSFKDSSVVDEDAYNPTASGVTHTSRDCKGGLYA